MKRTVVIFSGAGLSQPSGIPTFRDSKDGLWEKHKVEDVAYHEAYWKNKELVLSFFQARYENINSCQSNAAHIAIAELQEKYEVINITQNIDNLLERAGCTNVIHLHGNIGRKKCEKHSDIIKHDSKFNCNFKANGCAKSKESCPECGATLRPDVVLFNEAVDLQEDRLKTLVDMAYVFIGIGTSALVSPAANLITMFRYTPLKFFIDLEPSMRLQSFGIIKGDVAEKMPMLKDFLMQLE